MFFKFISLIVMINIQLIYSAGPHHPKNSYVIKRETRKQEFNEHLKQDKDHIAEDLSGLHVKHKDVVDMTDEEKSFYFFKVHDTDNNNYLDGLEMVKAALHRHTHNDNNNAQEELDHITSVVDEFLDFADLDKNGFLNYAEYVKAMTASEEKEVPQVSPSESEQNENAVEV